MNGANTVLPAMCISGPMPTEFAVSPLSDTESVAMTVPV